MILKEFAGRHELEIGIWHLAPTYCPSQPEKEFPATSETMTIVFSARTSVLAQGKPNAIQVIQMIYIATERLCYERAYGKYHYGLSNGVSRC